jgi:integrase
MPRHKLLKPNYQLRLRGRSWVIDWTDPDTGRTRSVSTRTGTRRAAEIWRDQWIAGQEQPAPPAQPRIADVIDHYLADRKPKVAAYDTLEWAAAGIKRHIGTLEPRMLARGMYVERRGRDGVSDGSIRREVGVLRAALKTAVRDQWIAEAPYVDMPSMPPPRERWLTRDDVDRLIDHAASPHLRLFIVLGFHTAARTGAILDLRWDQVDFDRRLIHYDRPGRQRSRKRRATVTMNIPALTALQSARAVATTDHVIEFRGKPVASIKNGFRLACDRAGIDGCTPHTLRHSSITHMVQTDVPLAQIARFSGDTEAMIEKVYGHHAPDYLRAAAEALAGRSAPRLAAGKSDDVGFIEGIARKSATPKGKK